MRVFFLILLLTLALHMTVRCQELYNDVDDYEDPLSVGGGTQQTCDACRTVMDQLLQEWHAIDNTSFLEAIEDASHKKEYVPVKRHGIYIVIKNADITINKVTVNKI